MFVKQDFKAGGVVSFGLMMVVKLEPVSAEYLDSNDKLVLKCDCHFSLLVDHDYSFTLLRVLIPADCTKWKPIEMISLNEALSKCGEMSTS